MDEDRPKPSVWFEDELAYSERFDEITNKYLRVSRPVDDVYKKVQAFKEERMNREWEEIARRLEPCQPYRASFVNCTAATQASTASLEALANEVNRMLSEPFCDGPLTYAEVAKSMLSDGNSLLGHKVVINSMCVNKHYYSRVFKPRKRKARIVRTCTAARQVYQLADGTFVMSEATFAMLKRASFSDQVEAIEHALFG